MTIFDSDISKFRKNLLERLYYLTFVSSLMPTNNGGIMDKTVRGALIEMSSFIKESSDDELRARGDNLYRYLVDIYNNYKKIYRPKKSQTQIGRDFNALFLNDKVPYNYGIEYGWLDERIEFKNSPYPTDLPYHAKVGIGVHFPSIGIEEEFMLRDAFYLLVKANEAYSNMTEIGKQYKSNGKDIENQDDYRILSNYNHTVATYSRLGTQSFYFFTEAFINSIGYDYYLRNKNSLSDNENEILQGKKNNRYIPLEHRIQKFQSIIREDKKIVIVTTDENQITEPFSTFFTDLKELRDAASHFSPIKGVIWLKPDEWLNKVKMAADICLEVSKQVWCACYPQRGLPEYLMKLNYDELFEAAQERSSDIQRHKID